MDRPEASAAVIARVAKLLKLAKSDNPNEAAIAAAQAQRLMDEHRLSAASVNVEADPMVRTRIDGQDFGRTSTWKRELSAVIGTHNGVVSINYGGRLDFVGRTSDVQVAGFLYDYLARTLDAMARAAGRGKGKAYGLAFRRGAIRTIALKLKADRGETTTGDRSTALVVQRDAEAREWLTKGGPLRIHRAAPLRPNPGLRDGYEAAKAIDLRRAIPTTPDSRRLTEGNDR